MKTYKVNDIFYSLQGEGKNAGTPAVFIRFAGCNLHCPFCDTDFKHGNTMTAEQIVQKAQSIVPAELPRLVVLTGGEPTLQVTEDLLNRLHTKFVMIAIETNGTHPIPKGVDFVTFSPKDDYTNGSESILGKADEVKVVFDGEHNPEFWAHRIIARDFFLQPCDTKSESKNREIVDKCVQYIKAHPHWRLSLQTHKILGIL